MTSPAADAAATADGGYVNVIEMTRFDHDDAEHRSSTIHANSTTLQQQKYTYYYY